MQNPINTGFEPGDLWYERLTLYHWSTVIPRSCFHDICVSHLPPRWCSGRASTSGAWGRGFHHRPGHTRNFKTGCNVSALIGALGYGVKHYDWLAIVFGKIWKEVLVTPWYNWTIVNSGVKHQTCLYVFLAVNNSMSIISHRFLGKLPVLLLPLTWHQRVR